MQLGMSSMTFDKCERDDTKLCRVIDLPLVSRTYEQVERIRNEELEFLRIDGHQADASIFKLKNNNQVKANNKKCYSGFYFSILHFSSEAGGL